MKKSKQNLMLILVSIVAFLGIRVGTRSSFVVPISEKNGHDIKLAKPDLVESHRLRPITVIADQKNVVDLAKKLSKKVLKTETEKQQFAKLLSDRNTLKLGLKMLASLDMHDRIQGVDLLTLIVQYKENPIRDQTISEIVQLLLVPLDKLSDDLETKKALLGDRIELFVLIHRQARESANRIISEVQGTAMERYYQFATAFYLKEKAGA